MNEIRRMNFSIDLIKNVLINNFAEIPVHYNLSRQKCNVLANEYEDKIATPKTNFKALEFSKTMTKA